MLQKKPSGHLGTNVTFSVMIVIMTQIPLTVLPVVHRILT
jgi:hypothetical protein